MEHAFLFDSHYALADSYWQVLQTDGVAKLTVMEALRCPPPSLNNGEDNAVFKSLIGTLIKCPGPGCCADPLFCKPGFLPVTVAESSTQTALPPWIDHRSCKPQKCPLTITRKTHPDNAAPTVSCRLQWRARRSQINILAKQAAELCNKAKRIPVLADTALIRGYQNSSAGQPARTDGAGQPARRPPEWRLLVCLNQMWTSKTGQAFPSFAPKVFDFLGHSMHHPHQISLAQFSAYHLREGR